MPDSLAGDQLVIHTRRSARFRWFRDATSPTMNQLLTTWMQRASIALLIALATACSPAPEEEASALLGAGDWPQWRGPAASGVSQLVDLPLNWGPESENIRWRAELTVDGVSQPIVAGDRIFVTGSRGGKGPIERSVTGIDLKDGSVLWETIINTRRAERKHHRFGSFSTPTPVTDGNTVWAYFGGFLAAVSRDGELLWSTDVDPDYWRRSRYGAASSPILTDGAVVVFGDDEWGREDGGKQSWLAAFDRESGEEIWRTEWPDTCCSYATPFLRQGDGHQEVVVATTPLLLGFDAATGERLWQLDLPIVQVVPSLVQSGDLLIQAGSVHEKKTIAFRLSGFGAETRGEQIWQDIRATPELASPVIYAGLLFTVSDGGIMSCHQPETGKLLWRRRLEGHSYRSALVAGDGKIYITSLGGKTDVVAAETKFRPLASNDMAEYSESSLAVTDECLLLRTEDHLYCIGREEPASAQADGGQAAKS